MNIINSNGVGNSLYNCNSADGGLKNVILFAQGSSKAGYKHAKNLAGKGNLKLLGKWFASIGAKVGDRIEIKFTSPTDILLTKL